MEKTTSQLKEARFGKAETIGTLAFSDCESLERVFVPKLKNLAAGAFRGCASLKEVVLSAGTQVVDIADSFDDMPVFPSRAVPVSVYIGKNLHAAYLADRKWSEYLNAGIIEFRQC